MTTQRQKQGPAIYRQKRHNERTHFTASEIDFSDEIRLKVHWQSAPNDLLERESVVIDANAAKILEKFLRTFQESSSDQISHKTTKK